MENQDIEKDSTKFSKTEKYLNYLNSAFVLFCIPIVVMVFNCAFQAGYFSYYKISLIYINKMDFSLILGNIDILYEVFALSIGVVVFLAVVKNIIPNFILLNLIRNNQKINIVFSVILLTGVLIYFMVNKEVTLTLVTVLEITAIVILFVSFIPKTYREWKLKKIEKECLVTNSDTKIEEFVNRDDNNIVKTQQEKASIYKVFLTYKTLRKIFYFGTLLIIVILAGQFTGLNAANNQKVFNCVTYEDQEYTICGIYEGKYILKVQSENKYRLVEIGQVDGLIESKTFDD